MAEQAAGFRCFGATCAVHAPSAEAVQRATRFLLAWHARFTRFEAGSELSRLNADPHDEVAVSAHMAAFVRAAVAAAAATGGLVDATLAGELERAGYVADLGGSLPLALALRLAPARRPARPSARARWREVAVDGDRVIRPAGLRLDSGGIVKGLAADLVAELVAGDGAVAIDCAGDLRLKGATPREVRVADPFTHDRVLHRFALTDGGVATSGIGRRSWLGADGRPAHHLLDPGTGRPAYTGVVQATALAPTAVEAETLAKAALLEGPGRGAGRLVHGGVLVFDDGAHEVVDPPPVSQRAPSDPSRCAHPAARG